MTGSIEQLATAAKQGDREALEKLIPHVQGKVYNLAVRMLGHPEDAEDAGQEILIKIITHLSDFRGESAFSTWMYKIAINHILSARKRRTEREATSFDQMATCIERFSAEDWYRNTPIAEMGILLEEMMISCTQGMLMSLDRNHRAAYILGHIIGIPGKQAAYILDITPEAYRQRLSRARAKMDDFMGNYCSLINQNNPCTCDGEVAAEARNKKLDPKPGPFTSRACKVRSLPELKNHLKGLKELERAAAVFQSHPDYESQRDFSEKFKKLIESGQVPFLPIEKAHPRQ